MVEERRADYPQIVERLATLEANQKHFFKTFDEHKEEEAEMRADIRAIRDLLNQAKGGYKAYVGLCVISAAVSAVIVKVWPLLSKGGG